MSFMRALREVLALEWLLVRRHRKLAAAMAGVLGVPALYALIVLWALWDPASHTRALPVGLVNLDAGARYQDRDLNLGVAVLDAIERHGQFNYRRYTDAEAARHDVRQGRLAFVLEIPADFSRQAVPGERAGAGRLTLFTSEGNNYSSAGFARRFAPEVAQRVNTMLSEARWELVLSSAEGSQRNLDTLRRALADLHQGATELHGGLQRARDGTFEVAGGTRSAQEAAQRLRAGTQQLAEAAPALAGGVRQIGPVLRTLEQRRPSDAELITLRQGARQLSDGHRELGRGLEQLEGGSARLAEGLGRFKVAADEVPIFGSSLIEGLAPLEEGAAQLGAGLGTAREGQLRLQAGALRLEDGVVQLVEGTQRAATALAQLSARLPDDGALATFSDGTRELARGSEALAGGLRALGAGTAALEGGMAQLLEGSGRLDTGLELLRRSLPLAVDVPGGSAQGLALSVQPVVEVAAPVPNNGTALTPNFVPLALWVGAVMAAFLVHLQRIAEPLVGLPRAAQVAGKLLLPAAVVVLQAVLMALMLAAVLHVPVAQPAAFLLTLVVSSLSFLLIVFAMVRLLGDLGRVLALLLLVVQVSAAGALLPIELSDAAFQAVHPYLPLTWVVQAVRATLFDAFDGQFGTALALVAGFGAASLALGLTVGRWRVVPMAQWRPPLDID